MRRSSTIWSAPPGHMWVCSRWVQQRSPLGPPCGPRLAASDPVFCDLKLNDIPSQIEGAVSALGELGATYTTVHALGGADMVRAAVKTAPTGLKILGVTILTSLEEADLAVLGIAGPVSEAVTRLAEVALESGASGLVCSGKEVASLRERFGPISKGGPLLVVPGIRLEGGPEGDQQRTSGPRGHRRRCGSDRRRQADYRCSGSAGRSARHRCAAERVIEEDLLTSLQERGAVMSGHFLL